MKILFLSLFLVSCSYFHTQGSRDRAKREKSLEQGVLPTFTYATTDLLHVSNLMVTELQKDGFKITQVDMKAGKIAATNSNKNALATFNSGFSGGRNYKVSESKVVEIQLTSRPEGVHSDLVLKNVSTFSMGQEEAEVLDPNGYHVELFNKVKLAL